MKIFYDLIIIKQDRNTYIYTRIHTHKYKLKVILKVRFFIIGRYSYWIDY